MFKTTKQNKTKKRNLPSLASGFAQTSVSSCFQIIWLICTHLLLKKEPILLLYQRLNVHGVWAHAAMKCTVRGRPRSLHQQQQRQYALFLIFIFFSFTESHLSVVKSD